MRALNSSGYKTRGGAARSPAGLAASAAPRRRGGAEEEKEEEEEEAAPMHTSLVGGTLQRP